MSKSGKNNSVRIIGGDWRGRRLEVADVPGLRPSGDRCRETLFNWLQPWTPAADCADLFAGTGALGFEAASRGASTVLMIEKHPRAQEVLRRSIEHGRGEVLMHQSVKQRWEAMDRYRPRKLKEYVEECGWPRLVQ